jgi:glucose/mannose-6-phosphate isomerase
MDLNDLAAFKRLDRENMLAEIESLPDQLLQAWDSSQTQPLPNWGNIRRVLVAGMGGSAIGADLLAAYVAPQLAVPLVVNRNYDLPAWAAGEETLVIASSHSGNTEETLSGFDQAVKNGCRVLAVTTGGKLAEAAGQAGAPVWQFEHQGQPRAAVGYSFGLLLGVLARLSLISDPAAELAGAAEALRAQQVSIGVEVPADVNPAKRIAGQLYGRYVMVYGADILEPVARRWKGQISEIAKAVGAFEALPEADHNTLAGVNHPEEVLSKVAMIFLRAPSYHPRNRLRVELTRRGFMLEGLSTDIIEAVGQTPLAQQWTCLHFGDYNAYYLAMAYGVDPTPVEAIESFKTEMKHAGPG